MTDNFPGGETGARDPLPKPTRLKAWIHACRLPTLTASVVPVLVGTAIAWRYGARRPLAALAALIGAVAIQIGTNLANDIFDHRKGADGEERVGPPRVLPLGWLGLGEVRRGMIVAFAVATVAGVYLASVAGWPVIVIGIASIAAGIAYTAGPFALAYIGLGDLAVFLFFGLVAVIGTDFVQSGVVRAESILAAIPVGGLATAILIVNNVRDVDSDRAAGKRTVAVLLGRGAARAEYITLLFAAYAIPVGLWARGLRSAWILLPLATATLAARTVHSVVERSDGPSLNHALLETARLHAWFGLLLAVGFALG